MLLPLRSTLLGAAVLVIGAPHAFATTSWCSSSTTQPIPFTIAQLQAASGNTPANGCVSGDLAITNISLVTATETGGAPQPTTSNIVTVGDDPTLFTGGTTPGTMSIPVALQGTGNTFVTNAVSQTQNTVLTYTISVVPGLFAPSDPSQSWMITTIQEDASFGGISGSGQTAEDELEFCLGDATFDCAPGQANYGNIIVSESAGVFTRSRCSPKSPTCTQKMFTSSPFSVIVSGFSTISFKETLTLATTAAATSDPNMSGGVVLAQTAMTSGQGASAPEPSTYVLFATGLGALAFWRKRNASDRG
jgi:hypothetical protein